MKFVNHPSELHAALPESNTIALCDENSFKHVYERSGLRMPVITVTSGERSKSIATCEQVWKELLMLNANRKTTLLCLGGGVITDLGAFVASTYMRGIKFIHVPSTLLAMVDASIGGKCGVNFNNLKNYIGTWAEPKEIFVCNAFLESLNEQDLMNGYAEMLKHGLIADEVHYREVLPCFMDRSIPGNKLIKRSMEIKNEIVSEDYYENSVRKKLNFGHSIAHALESLMFEDQRTIPHGTAVGFGIVVETMLSADMGLLSGSVMERICSDLSAYNSQVREWQIDYERIIPFLFKDKKNENNSINFTMLAASGSAVIDVEVHADRVRQILKKC